MSKIKFLSALEDRMSKMKSVKSKFKLFVCRHLEVCGRKAVLLRLVTLALWRRALLMNVLN